MYLLENKYKLIISDDVKKKFEALTKKTYPNEGCGMMIGNNDEINYEIIDVIPIKSVIESPVKFVMDDNELLNGYKTAESRGLKVLGIFHSHPLSPPIPSITDREYMEINTGIWIIQSGVDYQMRAYILRNEKIIEIEI